jgi:hypothetical protein
VNLGDTLFSTTHLWVVCSTPSPDGDAVIFNITTRRPDSDTNCIILPGDHPFVKKESVIAYERGQIMSLQNWVKAQKLGARTYPPASRELLFRIQQGALKSDLTPQKLQAIVKQSLIPDPAERSP